MPSPSRSGGGTGTYAACTTFGSVGTGGQLSASEKTCTGRGGGRVNGRYEEAVSLHAEGGHPTPQRNRARGAPPPSVSAPPPARSTANPRTGQIVVPTRHSAGEVPPANPARRNVRASISA